MGRSQLRVAERGDAPSAGASENIALTRVGRPHNSVRPAITGTNTVGQVQTCSQGTWSGLATITYSYQWYRGAAPIASATANTYTLTGSDTGKSITCRVRASNKMGWTEVTSLPRIGG